MLVLLSRRVLPGFSAGLGPPLAFLSTVARAATDKAPRRTSPSTTSAKVDRFIPKTRPNRDASDGSLPAKRAAVKSHFSGSGRSPRVPSADIRRQWGGVYAVNGAGSRPSRGRGLRCEPARARASGGQALRRQAAELDGVSRRGSGSASERRTNRRAPARRAAGSGRLGIATDPPVSEGTAPGHSGPIPTRCGARHGTGPPRPRCGAGDRSRRSVELQGQDARMRALPSKLRPCGLAPSTVAGLRLSGNDPDASFPSSHCPTWRDLSAFVPGRYCAPVLRPQDWTKPAGVSPARVVIGEPGSRPRFVAERWRAERGVKSLFGGSKRAGRRSIGAESCSLVTHTMGEPSRSLHGEGPCPTYWLVPEMPLVGSPRGMGSGTYARFRSGLERPVWPALSAKTGGISQW